MAAEIDALRAIADQIIRSNPLDPATWDVDFSPCLPIAKAHLHTWSVDVSNLPPLYQINCKTDLRIVSKPC
jgi:hypothetical protein